MGKGSLGLTAELGERRFRPRQRRGRAGKWPQTRGDPSVECPVSPAPGLGDALGPQDPWQEGWRGLDALSLLPPSIPSAPRPRPAGKVSLQERRGRLG